MAKIDVWLENGRSIFGFLQKMKEPVFVVMLKSEAGEIVPVYEGNNDVAPGTYQVVLYQPYDSTEFHNAGFINVYPEDEVVHIVLSYAMGDLISGQPCARAKNETEKEAMWQEYARSKEGRLKRHVGWNSANALKMING